MKKILVIGAGGISTGIHIPMLKTIPDIEISAVCDIDLRKAQAAAEKFGIPKYYASYIEMLSSEKADAAFVLTQPDVLFRVSNDCMRHGLHVFVEKPAGITLYQVETLARTSKETDVMMQVGFNRRFIPLVKTVLEKIKAVTEINQIEGTFVKHSDAAFYDGCSSAFICDTIHSIDLVQYIAASIPVSAATVTAKYGESPVNNAWNSVMRYENGITGIIKANYSTGGRVHSFEIHGDRASAYINVGFGDASCDAKIIYNEGVGTFSMASKGAAANNIEFIDGVALEGSGNYGRYYGYYYEDVAFIDAINGKKPLECGIYECVKTMQTAELLINSQI